MNNIEPALNREMLITFKHQLCQIFNLVITDIHHHNQIKEPKVPEGNLRIDIIKIKRAIYSSWRCLQWTND